MLLSVEISDVGAAGSARKGAWGKSTPELSMLYGNPCDGREEIEEGD